MSMTAKRTTGKVIAIPMPHVPELPDMMLHPLQ